MTHFLRGKLRTRCCFLLRHGTLWAVREVRAPTMCIMCPSHGSWLSSWTLIYMHLPSKQTVKVSSCGWKACSHSCHRDLIWFDLTTLFEQGNPINSKVFFYKKSPVQSVLHFNSMKQREIKAKFKHKIRQGNKNTKRQLSSAAVSIHPDVGWLWVW